MGGFADISKVPKGLADIIPLWYISKLSNPEGGSHLRGLSVLTPSVSIGQLIGMTISSASGDFTNTRVLKTYASASRYLPQLAEP